MTSLIAHRYRLAAAAATVALLLLLGFGPVAAQVSDYDRAMARADELELAGKLAEAADVLAAIAGDYQQDYALAIELAWLEFRAGRYGRAERAYRRALALSSGSIDARVGLAWTLLRLGRGGEAVPLFEAVLAEAPAHPTAARGLAIARAPRARAPALSWSLGMYGTFDLDPGADTDEASMAGLVDVNALIAGRWQLRGSARLARIGIETGGGQMNGQGDGRTDLYTRSELFATAGVGGRAAGVSASYGRLFGVDGDLAAIDLVGAIARLSVAGDAFVEGNVALFDDMDVIRLSPTWRIPLGGHLAVQPGLAAQWVSPDAGSRETRLAGFATLSAFTDHLSLAVGGKLGEEERPVYLFQPAVYDLDGVITRGAWAVARIGVGQSWWLMASYEYHGYDHSMGGAERLQLFTLGIEKALTRQE